MYLFALTANRALIASRSRRPAFKLHRSEAPPLRSPLLSWSTIDALQFEILPNFILRDKAENYRLARKFCAQRCESFPKRRSAAARAGSRHGIAEEWVRNVTFLISNYAAERCAIAAEPEVTARAPLSRGQKLKRNPVGLQNSPSRPRAKSLSKGETSKTNVPEECECC